MVFGLFLCDIESLLYCQYQKPGIAGDLLSLLVEEEEGVTLRGDTGTAFELPSNYMSNSGTNRGKRIFRRIGDGHIKGASNQNRRVG